MKYLLASYSKCATKSYSRAFRMLGFKVYDFPETYTEHHQQWVEIFDQNTSKDRVYELLYSMYHNVDVVVDAPAYFYWKEISDIFPECKFIFYERSLDSWIPSMKRQYNSYYQADLPPDKILRLITWLLSPTTYRAGKFMRKLNETIWNCGSSSTQMITMAGKKSKFNEIHTVKKYREHCAYFLRECSEKKRLIISQENFGKWEPICEFMDRDIPTNSEGMQEEFPHQNKNNQITQELGDMIAKTVQREQKFWLPIYGSILLLLLAFVGNYLFF